MLVKVCSAKKKRDPWREEMIQWRKFHFVQMLHLPVRLNLDAISNAERKYTNLIETNTYATDTYTHKTRHFDSLYCSIVDIWRILMMLSFRLSFNRLQSFKRRLQILLRAVIHLMVLSCSVRHLVHINSMKPCLWIKWNTSVDLSPFR